MKHLVVLVLLSLQVLDVALAAPVPSYIALASPIRSRKLYNTSMSTANDGNSTSLLMPALPTTFTTASNGNRTSPMIPASSTNATRVNNGNNTSSSMPAPYANSTTASSVNTASGMAPARYSGTAVLNPSGVSSIKPASATGMVGAPKSSAAAAKPATDTPPNPKNNSAKKSSSQVLSNNAATNSIKNNIPSTATGKVDDRAPTRTKAAAGDIMQSVTNWIADVDTVNRFLNVALTLPVGPTLKKAAQKALTYAQDEPVNLKLLKATPGLDADGLAAAEVLENVFGDVLEKLTNVVNSPVNLAVAINAVTTINNNRCKNVLPAAETLWKSAAMAKNMVNATWPPRANLERACSGIPN